MRLSCRYLFILVGLTGLSLYLLACTPYVGTDTPMPETPKTIRYLALGDSYTIGESVDEAERWPEQLAARLKEKNVTTDITIIARTGWATDELWNGIEAQGVEPPYDLVSLLIGVNNQYRGRGLDEYRTQFQSLLGRAIESADNDAQHIIVVSIPDWGVTPFADGRDRVQIAAEIDAFNHVNQEEAEKAGARYVEITPYSRTAKDDISLIAADGLHPSGKMYAGWVALILPVALDILR